MDRKETSSLFVTFLLALILSEVRLEKMMKNIFILKGCNSDGRDSRLFGERTEMKQLSFLALELERARRKKQALESLLERGKISQTVYDRLIGEVKEEIAMIEKKTELQAHEAAKRVDELRNVIQILERHLINLEINFSAGEIDEEQFKREKEIYASGIKSLGMEMESLERTLKGFPREEVEPEKGFHFYEGVGKPTGQVALSLEDFAKKARTVSIVCLEFHQERGDFANWIRDVFNEYSLAERIEKLKERGEKLRKKIIDTIEGPEQQYTFPCPNCGKVV
ncbi:MAG: CdvA-like protein, partial [Candidatus Bathyarchaeia archaeon]